MSQRGKPSTAHEYDKSEACIHCGMYRSAVIAMSHNCTVKREAWADEQDAIVAAKSTLAQAEANDHGE